MGFFEPSTVDFEAQWIGNDCFVCSFFKRVLRYSLKND